MAFVHEGHAENEKSVRDLKGTNAFGASGWA